MQRGECVFNGGQLLSIQPPGWSTSRPLSSDQIFGAEIFDWTGRPFDEDPKGPNPAGVPMKIDKSKLPGIRHNLDTNVSAYEAIAVLFTLETGLMSEIRSRLFHPGKNLTLRAKAELTNMFTALPLVLVMRAQNPLFNGHVHPAITNMGKMNKGATRPLKDILISDRHHKEFGTEKISVSVADTADSFVDFVDERGYLVAPRRVCPAPLHMIRMTMAAIWHPDHAGDSLIEQVGLQEADLEMAWKLGIINLEMMIGKVHSEAKLAEINNYAIDHPELTLEAARRVAETMHRNYLEKESAKIEKLLRRANAALGRG